MSQGGSVHPSSTEAAIRSLFEAGTAAWNDGDLDGYLEGYRDSEETRWITGGNLLYGKEAITAAMRSRFPSPQEMGSFELVDLGFDLVTDTDALVFGQWAHTASGIMRNGFFTVRLQRFGDDWFVVSDHTSSAP